MGCVVLCLRIWFIVSVDPSLHLHPVGEQLKDM